MKRFLTLAVVLAAIGWWPAESTAITPVTGWSPVGICHSNDSDVQHSETYRYAYNNATSGSSAFTYCPSVRVEDDDPKWLSGVYDPTPNGYVIFFANERDFDGDVLFTGWDTTSSGGVPGFTVLEVDTDGYDSGGIYTFSVGLPPKYGSSTSRLYFFSNAEGVI